MCSRTSHHSQINLRRFPVHTNFQKHHLNQDRRVFPHRWKDISQYLLALGIREVMEDGAEVVKLRIWGDN